MGSRGGEYRQFKWGLISARAGDPLEAPYGVHELGSIPACGGTRFQSPMQPWASGLSPRMRGNLREATGLLPVTTRNYRYSARRASRSTG